MKTSSVLRIVAVLLVVAVFATVLAVLPAKDYLAAMLRWIESIGPVGPVVLAGLYVVACVLFVPGSMLTLGAGFLFGVL